VGRYRLGLLTGASLVALAVLAAAAIPRSRPAVPAPTTGQVAGAVDDTTLVNTLLQESRGTSLLLCEMASGQLRGNYWGNREPVDESVRDLLRRVRHDPTDPAVVPLLTAALGDADLCVARTAARLLGRTDHPSAEARLLAALEDTSARVREMAALGLGVAEPAAALDPLIRVLGRDDDTGVRVMAAWALGELEDVRAVGPLADVLADGPAQLRATSAAALGEIEDDEAVPALVAALADDNPGVRLNAARALGEIEHPAAVEPLSQTLLRDSQPEVRRAAAQALGNIES